MGDAVARTVFIAAATNRHGRAADCSRMSSVVAFGSNRFVALWDPQRHDSMGTYQTLPGHQGEVTCVTFLPTDDALLSADDKGFLCLRRAEGHGRWASTAGTPIQAHDRGITALTALGDIVVSGASDSCLKVWRYKAEGLTLLQSINLRGRFPLDVALAVLPGTSSLIMAVASTETVIRVYTQTQDENFSFSQALSLEGHEDWVRCLSFNASSPPPASALSTLTLASGSQDNNIRLWVIEEAPARGPETGQDAEDVLEVFEKALLGDFGEEEAGVGAGKRISNRSHVFAVPHQGDGGGVNKHFTLTFDALLVGHENHVTSLSWRPRPEAPPLLLSSSTDASLILWAPATPIWVNKHRFGDIGGGKAGGFVGALWGGATGEEVMGWGWNGGWRRWREDGEKWSEANAITGHQGPVKGLAWDPNGDYLITCSLDQTTRIFGPWTRPRPQADKDDAPSNDTIQTWHELARPQIHGYDLIAPAFVDSLQFVSVADEKVARVFDAPRGFVSGLQGLKTRSQQVEVEDEPARPLGASVPPLGLSNKAAEEGDETFMRERDLVLATRPPFEGELANITLWPEVEKVFGHGYELYALASSRSGSLIATACKATTAEHAVVRVYDTKTWRAVGAPLAGHTLTITRISFSPLDDRFVLTASRDRTWRLFERQTDGYYLPLAAEKGHARIVWDCAWSEEGDIFATAGRDKLVKIWQAADESCKKWSAVVVLKQDEAATAVDFSCTANGRRRLAIGLENGSIVIYSSETAEPCKWTQDLIIDSSLGHIDQIHRIAWQRRPRESKGPGIVAPLIAACGEDGTVRVLDVHTLGSERA